MLLDELNIVLRYDYLPLEEVLGQADAVILCAALTPQSRHLLNARTLLAAKPGMLLINVARGGLIEVEDDGPGIPPAVALIARSSSLRSLLRNPVCWDRRITARIPSSRSQRRRPPSISMRCIRSDA